MTNEYLTCIWCKKNETECELMGIEGLDLFGNGLLICMDCVIYLLLWHWGSDVHEVIDLYKNKIDAERELEKIMDKNYERRSTYNGK